MERPALQRGGVPGGAVRFHPYQGINGESSRVVGNLTMHGVAREITLDVLVQGTDTDPWGNTRAGLEIVVKLLRS
jgi:polyisoprenoid-binding protein YceI